MYNVKSNFHIIENLSELPNLQNREEIFLDVETQRNWNHEELGGLYPWKGDKICGFSISANDIPDIWYTPIRHIAPGSKNLPIKNVMLWIQDILATCKDWINHEVKFDAMMFDIGDNIEFKCRLVDTLTLSKVYYSDRLTYALKPLCKDWLNYDLNSRDEVQDYLKRIKSKNFAEVPIDILGKYCCDDVQMDRQLYRYLQKNKPEQINNVWETEIKLTPILFDIEKYGLRIDPLECKKESVKCLKTIIDSSTKIVQLTDREFTNSNDCIYDIFVNQFNLPILNTIKEKDEDGRWYDTGRPTFDADTLALYKLHPSVTSDPKINEIVNLICEYRKESQFKSLFLDTFLDLEVDGIIHPNYDQVKRTGRMSCRKPNSQQQNSRSKSFIHPHIGNGFISNDYSQIEFRLIVHYCNMQKAIKQYNENPNTDFHQFVADLFHVKRKFAKTQNFGTAFGMGKRTTIERLETNESIMEEIGNIVNKLIEENKLDANLRILKFRELCKKHAEAAYEAYHKEFPEIKLTSEKAKDTASIRGFVFDAYGRRRYLPGKFSRKAFNTIIQSCAADVMKERLVAISPRYNSESRKWGIKNVANVHDNDLKETPLEVLYNPNLHKYICSILEDTAVKFRIPILIGLGISPNNWAEADADESIKDEKGNIIAGKVI